MLNNITETDRYWLDNLLLKNIGESVGQEVKENNNISGLLYVCAQLLKRVVKNWDTGVPRIGMHSSNSSPPLT